MRQGKVRVWLGKRSGWWRCACPCCNDLGSFHPSQKGAYAAALAHIDEKHSRDLKVAS